MGSSWISKRSSPDRSCISTSDPETFRSQTQVTQRWREEKLPEGEDGGGMGRRSKRKGLKDRELASSFNSAVIFCLQSCLTLCIMYASPQHCILLFQYLTKVLTSWKSWKCCGIWQLLNVVEGKPRIVVLNFGKGLKLIYRIYRYYEYLQNQTWHHTCFSESLWVL